MGQLRYYDEVDIQNIASTCRLLINTDKKLKVSDMSNFLKCNEPTNRKVNSNAKDIYVKYYEDISSYRINKSSVNSSYYADYPSLTYEDGYDYADYIFAGWFTSDDLTTSIFDATSGGAYAKFINIDTLQASFQVSAGTTAESDNTSLGIIFGIIDTDLSSVGLIYSYEGADETFIHNTKVYTGLNAAGNKIYSKAFNNRCHYLTRQILSNVPNNLFGTPISFKTAFVTLDDTLV